MHDDGQLPVPASQRYDKLYAIITVPADQHLREAAAWFRTAGWSCSQQGERLEVTWRGCRLLYTTVGTPLGAAEATTGVVVVLQTHDLAAVSDMFALIGAPVVHGRSRFGAFVEGRLPRQVRLQAVSSPA